MHFASSPETFLRFNISLENFYRNQNCLNNFQINAHRHTTIIHWHVPMGAKSCSESSMQLSTDSLNAFVIRMHEFFLFFFSDKTGARCLRIEKFTHFDSKASRNGFRRLKGGREEKKVEGS